MLLACTEPVFESATDDAAMRTVAHRDASDILDATTRDDSGQEGGTIHTPANDAGADAGPQTSDMDASPSTNMDAASGHREAGVDAGAVPTQDASSNLDGGNDSGIVPNSKNLGEACAAALQCRVGDCLEHQCVTAVSKLIPTDAHFVKEASPYYFTNDIQIGGVLRVDPGVQVMGAGHVLQVFGGLAVDGTETDRAQLTNMTITSDLGAMIDLRFAHLTRLTLNVSLYWLRIRDSLLEQLGNSRIASDTLASFERNQFTGYGNVELVTLRSGSALEFHHNYVGAPAVDNSAGLFMSTLAADIHLNTFANAAKVGLKNSSDLDLTQNFWSTADTTQIDEVLWDRQDDLGLGTIHYLPFLSSADAMTPGPGLPWPTTAEAAPCIGRGCACTVSEGLYDNNALGYSDFDEKETSRCTRSESTGMCPHPCGGNLKCYGGLCEDFAQAYTGCRGGCALGARCHLDADCTQPGTCVRGVCVTPITGAIDANEEATWDVDHSPYGIVSEFRVLGTLHLDPGVRVLSTGPAMIITGELRVPGTVENDVRFDGVRIQNSGTANFEHTRFVGGIPLDSGSGTTTMSACRLDAVGPGRLDGNWVMSNSVFLPTSMQEMGKSSLSDNYIEPVGVNGFFQITHGSPFVPEVVFHGNTFGPSKRVMIVLTSSGGLVDAASNYWSTSDETGIERLIYDHVDDVKVPVSVSYKPFLTAPSPAAATASNGL